MTRTRHALMLLLALGALLALPAAALADGDAVIADCSDDGELQGNHDRDDLREARDNLPTDADEYTGCREAIDSALASSRRGRGGGGSGTGSAGSGGITATDPSLITDSGAVAASREDLAALYAERRAREAGANGPKVNIDGREITPGPNGVTDVATAANEVPPPLIAALAAFAALALLAGALLFRRRWPQTRRAALRLLRR